MDHRILICIFACVALACALPQPKLTERTDDDGVTWVGPIRKCKNGGDAVFDECLRNIVKDLTPLVGSGIDEIGLQPLDPLELNKFALDRSLGPINITLQAKNTIITGFTNYKTLKFIVDAKNMKIKFIYEVPLIRISAHYKLGGNAFFFPLTGSGPAHIEIFNFKTEGEFLGKFALNSNGEEVTQVDKMVFNEMTIRDMNLQIRGLFDGNTILSSLVHTVGKRYAREVFDVIRPDLQQFVSSYLRHDILNPIMNQLPHVAEYVPRN